MGVPGNRNMWTSTYISAAALPGYAAEQVLLGTEVMREHSADLTGCCRRCGRPYPCPAFRDGAAMVAHFESWAEDPRPARPYVA